MANPRGQQRDKPYREALRMELAAAGDDMRQLRKIARAHLELAQKGDMHAIKEMADRLDGKPAQEATITHVREVAERSDADIAARLDELGAGGTRTSTGNGQTPIDPSKLN